MVNMGMIVPNNVQYSTIKYLYVCNRFWGEKGRHEQINA